VGEHGLIVEVEPAHAGQEGGPAVALDPQQRVRLLLARMAETTNRKKADHLAARAMKGFKKVARMAANAELTGTVSFGCGQALEAMVDEARARLAR